MYLKEKPMVNLFFIAGKDSCTKWLCFNWVLASDKQMKQENKKTREI